MWELYGGSWFTGSEAYGTVSVTSLGSFSDKTNSIIIIGKSYWTFYEGYSYSGKSVCLYANRHLSMGNQDLDFGSYPYVTSLGLSNNAIRSVRKGCYSKNVVAPLEVEALQMTNDTLVFAVPPQK
ncbi:uncharacterized protein [Panulirus ornatus]|uniref:uncharacterized protein isoform X1 n=1 Tax=Panulirus ornatus TaxID=150431 RepID=UPI003A851301